jgi:8-oxo-dGTP pyrophosphatase MutT (NUDIX family)
VVLVRPGSEGIEVLLTRRPRTMAFAAGLHVFPGGRVDAADADPDHPLARDLTGDEASTMLAGALDGEAARAHFVAAARETLEETGIHVAARDLVALSRWVTPSGLVRRFDTWFFAAPVPPGTDIARESSEVESAAWLTPAAALAAARTGELAMLQPTLVTLEQLAGLPDVAAIRAAFATGGFLDSPVMGEPDAGVAVIDQRWAGGIPGRRATGWLVGEHDLVLVDPADPTGVTSAVVDAAVAARGGHLVAIALTGLRPDQHAGVELYAAGGGLPVFAGPGAAGHAPYPVTELRPGDPLPLGDVALTAETSRRVDPGAVDYRLPCRRLP